MYCGPSLILFSPSDNIVENGLDCVDGDKAEYLKGINERKRVKV
jgi:hypothetical protein